MPWYKFTYHYGPGHQATEIQYHYYEHEIDPKYEKDEIQDWAYMTPDLNLTDHWTGKVEKAELPEQDKNLLIKRYRRELEAAKYMLKVLGVEE